MTLAGIDRNYWQDLGFGILAGILFIIISVIAPGIGAIGFPSLPQSVTAIGIFLIIIVVAPIFETSVFQDIILDFFDSKLKIFGKGALPFFLASLLSSVAFSLFHLTAYGGSLQSAGGSFLSAFLVGVGFCYLRKWTKSILPVIIAHALINFWTLYSPNILIT